MAFYRATQKGHLPSGEIWDSTVHIEDVAGNAATLITVFADAVTLLWQGPPTPANSIQQLVPTTVGLDEIVVDELNNLGHNVAQEVATLALPGTSVDDMLPYQVSVGYSKRTGQPNRAGRGRGFLPPFALTTCVGGLLDATAQAQVTRAAGAFLSHIAQNSTGGPVVYHNGFNTGTLISSCDVGNVFDTQRRRRNQITETRISIAVG
jgi:hypothetical protein